MKPEETQKAIEEIEASIKLIKDERTAETLNKAEETKKELRVLTSNSVVNI